MNRDFRKGHIEIDFGTRPFESIGGLLLSSTRFFLTTLPFIAGVTLIVLIPAKFGMQFAGYLLDVPKDGILSYFLMDFGDLVFGALAVPAVIYGLAMKLRTGQAPPVRESLRWGRRFWGKSLWNRFKVEITITLWGLLLVIPGVVAMVRLILTDPIVAVEGDLTTDVLQRSRELTAGCGWKTFLAILPALPISLAHLYAGLRTLQYSRWLMAAADSLFSVADQWLTVVVLFIYLGVRRRDGGK